MTRAPSGSLADVLGGIWRMFSASTGWAVTTISSIWVVIPCCSSVHARLATVIDQPVALVDLLRCPTIQSLVQRIEGVPSAVAPAPRRAPSPPSAEPVAVIGMACRFPGADTPEGFSHLSWRRIGEFFQRRGPRRRGASSAVRRSGVRQSARGSCRYRSIRRRLFRLRAHEAELLDPQQRLFLEVAWEALERARRCASIRVKRGIEQRVGNSRVSQARSESAEHEDGAGAIPNDKAADHDVVARADEAACA